MTHWLICPQQGLQAGAGGHEGTVSRRGPGWGGGGIGNNISIHSETKRKMKQKLHPAPSC